MGWENFDPVRVGKQLEDLALIGKTEEGGTTRLAFTPADIQAKEYVKKLMLEAGMVTYYDPVGNLIGVYEGLNPEMPGIIMGSHLDTVPNGGKYDGIAGVLVAVEIVRTFFLSGHRFKPNITVVAFADEEGVRFGGSLFGSRAMTGLLSPEWLERTDEQGIKLKKAMTDCGFNPANFEQAKIDPAKFKAYFELHIEQGRILEKADCPIGLVLGISAPSQLWATIRGRADHAGATPMGERKDALAAAAELILAVEKICTPKEGQVTVGTVGSISVQPNALNVIPGEVRMSLDIRDIDINLRNQAIEGIKESAQEIALRRGIDISLEETLAIEPVILDQNLINALEQVCQKIGLTYKKLISGAGHDAMLMAKIIPSAMIFVRCRDGISHSPDEFAQIEDLYLGAKLLYHTIGSLL
ncbi:MAG TPA: M20 family metallo-hydrolase [Clostridia bacterium]|nr:M20 family metallo-hydrolase [Clostridia bacterium]